MAKQIVSPVTDVSKEIHEVIQRTGYVEERYKNFEGKLKQLQSNVVEHSSEMRKVIRALDKEILALQKEMDSVKEAMRTLTNEIKLRATKEDLAVLNRYVDHWNPFQFVTADQVEDIVEEVIQRMQSHRRK